MIEEIKKEIEPLLVLDDVLYCKDCGSRNIKKSYKPYKIGEKIMKILDKYKDKAWEELKEYITKENITIQGIEVLEQENLLDKIEELFKKYSLDKE